jgi:hypothetical protein
MNSDFEDKIAAFLADEIQKAIDEEILRDVLGRSGNQYYRMDWFFRDTIEWKEISLRK